jgi:hypothetical protein
MNIFLKLWTWLKVNLASIIGAAQLVIKALKELLTAIINLISIFFPAAGAQKFVLALRAGFEAVDAFIEKIKPYLIPAVV